MHTVSCRRVGAGVTEPTQIGVPDTYKYTWIYTDTCQNELLSVRGMPCCARVVICCDDGDNGVIIITTTIV